MEALAEASRPSLVSRITRFFLQAYEREGLVGRKQAESLMFTLLAMTGATLIISLVMTNKVVSLAILGIAVLSATLLVLVKFGRAGAASAAATLILSLSFAALSFSEPYVDPYELFMLTSLQGLVLMITGIIARGKWQSMGVMAIALSALSLDFWLRLVPAGRFSINIDDYVICILVIVFSASIGRAIMSKNSILLAKAEAEARASARGMASLESAIESGKGSLDLGAVARNSAERTQSLIDEQRALALSAKARMEALAESIRAINGAQAEIASSSAIVHQNVADQTAIVAESSAAIEQMTASINGITAITSSRRDSISRLKDTTRVGAEEMARAAEAVKAMEASSASILDVVGVIRAVASRTNLLAMNAAIEAAHAGDAGAGFSVVADEIRKLSEATGQNVKLISASIKGTIESVRTAAEANRRSQDIFGQIGIEADSVSAAMEEISRGLVEMAEGTGEILKGVAESVSITSKVKDAATNMDEKVKLSSSDLEALGASAAEVALGLAAIASRFENILEEARTVSAAGRDNEVGLLRLSDALERLKDYKA